MAEIKAIETVYNGYRFRSRLEARWAVFFDALGIKYEYEKEGYDLGDAGWYLPDFWLPDDELWVEIKGPDPTPKDIHKIKAMTNNPVGDIEYPCVIMFTGQIRPLLMVYEYDLQTGISVVCSNPGKCFAFGKQYPQTWHFSKCQQCGYTTVTKWGLSGMCPVDDCKADSLHIGAIHHDIDLAFDKAVQARFEHGEKG